MKIAAALAVLVWAGPAGAADLPTFYPSAVDAATGLAVTPGQFTPARECSYCHPLQYEQWSGTMHANAFADPLYQAVWREASRDTGGRLDRFCAGCHTPVGAPSEQVWIRASGEIVIHPRATEGVTCDFCHTVAEVRPLEKGGSPGNAGLSVAPDGPKRGPYADASNSFHGTAFSDVHTRSELCAACHNVFHPVTNTAIARTYEEWKGSVYAEHEIQCQDCHMAPPEVAAQVAATLEKQPQRGLTSTFGTERSPFFEHTFTGANAAVPTLLGHWQTAADARKRLQIAARVALSAPSDARPGAPLPLEVRVENARAGHNLPTSMTEIRQMWLHVTVRDEGDGGRVLWESGALDARGTLDPGARRYGSRAVDVDGNPTWKPWQVAKIERDTSIPPRGSAVEAFSVPVPEGAKGPLRVDASLRYRSFSQEVADEYLGKPGWIVPDITMTSAAAQVRVAPRAP